LRCPHVHTKLPAMSLTEAQRKHLTEIQFTLHHRLTDKYERGQQEHGGNLWEKPALPELIHEVTDLVTYVVTLEGRLRDLLSTVKLAQVAVMAGHKEDALALLLDVDQTLTKEIGKK
jgi:hypothetical protein